MKKNIIVLTSALMLFSCSKNTNESSKHIEVAKKFTESVMIGETETAKKYATEATRKMIDFSTGLGTQKTYPNFIFKTLKDSVNGNQAWVKFTDEKNTKKTDEVYLIKNNEKWLVHFENRRKKVLK